MVKVRDYQHVILFSAQVNHFQHFVHKRAMIAVQGADPGTASDVGAVRGHSASLIKW